jgi:lysophospholipase L1-like esterase
MLDCLILGDSIAKGISDIRHECVAHVKSGINSHEYSNRFLLHTNGDLYAHAVIISLGSNDTKNIDTYEELMALRENVKSDRVYWILPNIKEDKRKQVWMVATKFGDIVIDARNHARSPDHIHPTYQGYRTLADDTRKK